jgi:hypothetical protein
MCNSEFIKRMHEEKLESQKRRAEFNIKKFLFVGALFSIGAAKLPQEIDLTLVLYIVPAISICFDLFILGEDYGIKRIGGFIRSNCADTIDATWENWVGSQRDPFATFAVSLLTLLVLVASVAIMWSTQKGFIWFWIWLSLNASATVFLFKYSQHLRKRLLIVPSSGDIS